MSFSGRATRDEAGLQLSLVFKLVEQKGIRIVPITDGTLFPQATFTGNKVTTSITVDPDSGEIVPVSFASDSFLLVRILK